MTPDVVFVHGMFMNPKSWAGWVQFFENRGHRCHTVAWPGHEGEPAALRASPPAILRELRLEIVVQKHREVLDGLGSPPWLIGHSVGGLIVQKLINEGRGLAGVALDAAPPRGIRVASWSFLKANLPVVNPFAGRAPFLFTVEQFQYAFCNTLDLKQTQAIYDAFVVPESRGIARSVAGRDAYIDFARPHAPLLLIGGELDNIVPWRIDEKTWKAYRDPASVHEFKLLPGRTHFLCGQDGWEETAALCRDWLARATPG